MKQVLLTGEMIGVVRGAVLALLRQHCYDRSIPNYQARALTDAFDISPADLGFAFDSWDAYYAHAEAVLYPHEQGDYASPTPPQTSPSPFYG